MNIKKLVLTVADGSEKVLDFAGDVNFTSSPTTISKIVETLEDNTQVTVFPGRGDPSSSDPVVSFTTTTQSGVVRTYKLQ